MNQKMVFRLSVKERMSTRCEHNVVVLIDEARWCF